MTLAYSLVRQQVADKRRGEAAQGLRHDDQIASRADRRDDTVRVILEASLRIIAGKIDSDGFVSRRFKERHHAMPVPSDATCAGKEYEVRHLVVPS